MESPQRCGNLFVPSNLGAPGRGCLTCAGSCAFPDPLKAFPGFLFLHLPALRSLW